MARRHGVSRTAAVVKRANYGPIYRQLGIDIVLSPRTVASDHILRFCRGAAVHSVHTLEDGAAEVIELTAQRGSSMNDTPLKRLRMPKGSLICAVIRPDDVTVPRGEDEIHVGDRVVVVATAENLTSVELLFRGRRVFKR